MKIGDVMEDTRTHKYCVVVGISSSAMWRDTRSPTKLATVMYSGTKVKSYALCDRLRKVK